MRRFLPVPLVLAALAAGCDSPAPTDALGATPSFAKAGTTITNEWIAVDRPHYNVCTGEVVLLTGKMHVRITTTIAADGSARRTLHLNYANVTGLGAVTGLSYQLVAAAKTEQVATVDPLTETTVVQQQAALVSQGSADNYKEHLLIRTSFDGTSSEFEIVRANTGCEA